MSRRGKFESQVSTVQRAGAGAGVGGEGQQHRPMLSKVPQRGSFVPEQNLGACGTWVDSWWNRQCLVPSALAFRSRDPRLSQQKSYLSLS